MRVTLRLITGRAGSGKTTLIQKEIAEELKRSPMGEPIFVIVPDQMSFSMEQSLSIDYGLNGLIRAQVLTFKRLAWRVLQDTGGITQKEIDSFGYRMLVRSVLEDNQADFKLFRQAANKRGFTEQMGDVLKEFNRYCLDEASLFTIQQELIANDAPRTLIDKTEDLSLLVTKIKERLGKEYVDPEGHLTLLSAQIENADMLKGAQIYIDGFESFTTREYEILTELMKFAKCVTVVLPMDNETRDFTGQELFSTPMQTAIELRERAKEASVEIEEGIFCGGSWAPRFGNADLVHLEKVFDQYPSNPKQSDGHVQIIEAVDPRAEIHAVARKIRQMMLEGKRYLDIAILYRQPGKYDELIETIFPHYDIPVFISHKKTMLHHPLIEFSRSILEAVTKDWSYEAVFRAVKTDLFFPHREQKSLWRDRADRLENYVLAHGIYGKRWADESRWKVKRYRGLELHTNVQTDAEKLMEQELHQVRDTIREPLQTLETNLKNAKTGREVAVALFELMESLQVYDKIIDLRADEEKAGRLRGATEHEQAWNGWIHILDQFVLMFGDQAMDVKDAARILDEGFDSLEFSQIPPSLDQVTVASVDVSGLMNMSSVFVIGVNDGVLPRRIDSEGILSDADREWFEQIGFQLAPTSKMQLMDETFMAYRAFTSPSEELIVSYPVADGEGSTLLPSLYIARIQQLLPGTETLVAVTDPSDLPAEASNFDYISHPRAALPYVSNMIRQAEWGEPVLPAWRAVLAYFEEDPLWASILQHILHPLKVGNQSERLHPEYTKALYGESFISSVSRVESYYSCPFQHFATYGLGLRERTEYTLEAPAIGDLFHAALKWVSDEVIRLNHTWSNLTKEQCWQLAKSAVQELTPYFFNRILLSTSRYLYIQHKLKRILQQTIYSMSVQSKSSVFHPVALEAAFGPGEQYPPLEIPLRRGNSMQLRGRIDRIDATEIGGKHYMRVVDYKSSARQLDLSEVYYGLSLQMLTYLDVALEHAEAIIGSVADPAGVLYMHVHNPMIRPGAELTPEDLEKEIVKSYKMRGYLLENPDVARGMDADIGRTSLLIPASINKDGSFSKASKVLATDDLQMMRTFVRKKHQQAGDAMIAGDARVYPYKLKDQMPCNFCAYQAVCRFDGTDPAQDVRRYPVLDPTESLENMRKGVEGDEHSR